MTCAMWHNLKQQKLILLWYYSMMILLNSTLTYTGHRGAAYVTSSFVIFCCFSCARSSCRPLHVYKLQFTIFIMNRSCNHLPESFFIWHQRKWSPITIPWQLECHLGSVGVVAGRWSEVKVLKRERLVSIQNHVGHPCLLPLVGLSAAPGAAGA